MPIGIDEGAYTDHMPLLAGWSILPPERSPNEDDPAFTALCKRLDDLDHHPTSPLQEEESESRPTKRMCYERPEAALQHNLAPDSIVGPRLTEWGPSPADHSSQGLVPLSPKTRKHLEEIWNSIALSDQVPSSGSWAHRAEEETITPEANSTQDPSAIAIPSVQPQSDHTKSDLQHQVNYSNGDLQDQVNRRTCDEEHRVLKLTNRELTQRRAVVQVDSCSNTSYRPHTVDLLEEYSTTVKGMFEMEKRLNKQLKATWQSNSYAIEIRFDGVGAERQVKLTFPFNSFGHLHSVESLIAEFSKLHDCLLNAHHILLEEFKLFQKWESPLGDANLLGWIFQEVFETQEGFPTLGISAVRNWKDVSCSSVTHQIMKFLKDEEPVQEVVASIIEACYKASYPYEWDNILWNNRNNYRETVRQLFHAKLGMKTWGLKGNSDATGKKATPAGAKGPQINFRNSVYNLGNFKLDLFENHEKRSSIFEKLEYVPYKQSRGNQESTLVEPMNIILKEAIRMQGTLQGYLSKAQNFKDLKLSCLTGIQNPNKFFMTLSSFQGEPIAGPMIVKKLETLVNYSEF